MKNDNFFPFYNKNTQFDELNDKDVLFFRNYMRRVISEFFDENSTLMLEKNIFELNKNLTLHDYIKKLARILIFIDEKYMRNVAKLFNDKLWYSSTFNSTLNILGDLSVGGTAQFEKSTINNIISVITILSVSGVTTLDAQSSKSASWDTRWVDNRTLEHVTQTTTTSTY